MKRKIFMGCAAVLSLVTAILFIICSVNFPENDYTLGQMETVNYFIPSCIILAVTAFLSVVSFVLECFNIKTAILVPFLVMSVASEILIVSLMSPYSDSPISNNVTINFFTLLQTAALVVGMIFGIKGKKWGSILSIVFLSLFLINYFYLWLPVYSDYVQELDSAFKPENMTFYSFRFYVITSIIIFLISEIFYFGSKLCVDNNEDTKKVTILGDLNNEE